MENPTLFKCFRRTWWKENPAWPNGLEPEMGRKIFFKGGKFNDELSARDFCREWNRKNPAGRLSMKAEFMEV